MFQCAQMVDTISEVVLANGETDSPPSESAKETISTSKSESVTNGSTIVVNAANGNGAAGEDENYTVRLVVPGVDPFDLQVTCNIFKIFWYVFITDVRAIYF